jgi:hypothetical protein
MGYTRVTCCTHFCFKRLIYYYPSTTPRCLEGLISHPIPQHASGDFPDILQLSSFLLVINPSCPFNFYLGRPLSVYILLLSHACIFLNYLSPSSFAQLCNIFVHFISAVCYSSVQSYLAQSCSPSSVFKSFYRIHSISVTISRLVVGLPSIPIC